MRLAAAAPLLACSPKVDAPTTAQPDPEFVALMEASPREVTGEVLDALYRLYAELGARLGLLPGDRAFFESIVQAKSSQPPSYAAEYESAAGLVGRHGPMDALARLVDPARRGSNADHVHARRFVIEEFTLLLFATTTTETPLAHLPGYWWNRGARYRRLEGVSLI